MRLKAAEVPRKKTHRQSIFLSKLGDFFRILQKFYFGILKSLAEVLGKNTYDCLRKEMDRSSTYILHFQEQKKKRGWVIISLRLGELLSKMYLGGFLRRYWDDSHHCDECTGFGVFFSPLFSSHLILF